MFVSGKANIPELRDGYGIAYDFGGNLKNITNTTGVNATFGNNLNKCRFSGYWQEDIMSPWIGEWGAYTTTIYGNYFHSGFFIKASDKTINASGSVKDTITITNMPVTLTSLQVFVSIPNSPTTKLSIYLRAPNGTSKLLATGHGDYGDDNGYLTIFDDASTLVLSTGEAEFFSPWSNYVHADVTMGTFSSTTINGNWILTVYDSSTSEKAKLMGWGLRPNNIINVGIDPISTEIPDVYNLYQNYPNPFNPVTNIKFEIPKTSLVKITVYDILGKEIQSILNENKEPGIYEVKFDGSKLSSGTYFYRIEAGNYTAFKKMILLK
jgi:subtilisin-like proprotein convertase family protein